jgi:hypothetical protein
MGSKHAFLLPQSKTYILSPKAVHYTNIFEKVVQCKKVSVFTCEICKQHERSIEISVLTTDAKRD